MLQDASDMTETLEDLSRPEHLLVWALRALAVGHGDCPLLETTFSKACGERGAQALTAYLALVRYIGMTGRRRLRVHVPGCPCVSVDEKAIVGVVAAAQDSLKGAGEGLLKMRLKFLVEGEPHPAFILAAQTVAQALKLNGQSLPLRLHDDGPTAPDFETARLRVVQ
jgi:hypothetical protein